MSGTRDDFTTAGQCLRLCNLEDPKGIEFRINFAGGVILPRVETTKANWTD